MSQTPHDSTAEENSKSLSETLPCKLSDSKEKCTIKQDAKMISGSTVSAGETLIGTEVISTESQPPSCSNVVTQATSSPRKATDDEPLSSKEGSIVRLQTSNDECDMDRISRCPHQDAVQTQTVPGSRPLCYSCSRSMLTYIAAMQHFLDKIADDVSKQIDPHSPCLEYVQDDLYKRTQIKGENALTRKSVHVASVHTQTEASRDRKHLSLMLKKSDNNASSIVSTGQSFRNTVSDATFSTQKDEQVRIDNRHESVTLHDHKSESLDAESEKTASKFEPRSHHLGFSDSVERAHDVQSQQLNDQPEIPAQPSNQDVSSTKRFRDQETSERELVVRVDIEEGKYFDHPTEPAAREQPFYHRANSDSQTASDLQEGYSRPENENRVSLITSATPTVSTQVEQQPGFHISSSPQFPRGDSVDGILSTIYRLERGLQDVSKGPTIWQRLAQLESDSPFQASSCVTDEAFVSFARNNADALGCLVLGASLLLCGTSRTLFLLVSDEVSPTFLAPLSSIFHEVQHVRSLESLGTTKLSLLDQPELGICFSKLNVWRLEQFAKCVFLSPDTMVVQHCDELFCHEELSAVPDIGWPDCFNSAVFVYKPSTITFWSLLEFAEKQGSYDGGDQGLLNAYFDSWAQDIHKKLSFIYNLMANVSYTYTPAFKQFGRNVKVVQFVGPYKPWHVKFYSSSGQIAPSAAVHPTYVQFVYVWLCIFRTSVLPLFSQAIQAFASSQNVINAYELLRFFPSVMDSDVEFLLAPPSVRLRPTDSPNLLVEKLQLPPKTSKSTVPHFNSPLTPDSVTAIPENYPHQEDNENNVFEESTCLDESFPTEYDDSFEGPADAGASTARSAGETSRVKPESMLPGSEVGDYQGMSAWEQGRMDYQGDASSDTIIQRLHYLMGMKDRLV